MAETERAVVDGQTEPTLEELVAGIEEKRARWRELVKQAGARVNEPGVAGEWTLRDVVAHMGYYLRFHVDNLGGPARPFVDMPQDVAWDMERRNRWAHEQDKGLDWEFVWNEERELEQELVAQLRRRSQDEWRAQLTPWHHWPMWRWMCDARNHYDEHIPGLEAWLGKPIGTSG
jgi:hypothetical protein